MLVIGIDPGTETTGYGIIREDLNNELQVIDYGIIHTGKELKTEQRLQIIYKKLCEIINLHHPDSGVVEKLFFQKNITTGISVGQARGVILLALANAGLEVFEYTPNEVKQAVTGYGSAEKKQIQMMVQTILNLENTPKPDDAADALAVAICHIHSIGYLKRMY